VTMLAESVDVVIGVDTHKHTHTAAVVAAGTGAALEDATAATDPDGYAELLAMAERHSGLRAWAIEGTGGYGAGLTRYLADRGKAVIELDRPHRPPDATAPSPTHSTLSALPAKLWLAPTSQSPEQAPSEALSPGALPSAVPLSRAPPWRSASSTLWLPQLPKRCEPSSEARAPGPCWPRQPGSAPSPTRTSRPPPPRTRCAPWPDAA